MSFTCHSLDELADYFARQAKDRRERAERATTQRAVAGFVGEASAYENAEQIVRSLELLPKETS